MKMRSSVTIFLIIVVSVGLLFGLNVYTAPLIEANGAASELEPLFAVMPDAKGFECLYTDADAASSTLSNVPESVKGIYKETGELGYALSLSAVDGYTGETMLVSMAVGADGKISGIKIDTYSGSKEIPADYPETYVGQDSALGGVSLVSGVTYSSTAFKTAVSDGFTALVENGLIGAGVKTDDQVLMELLPTLYPGIANASGIAQTEPVELSGSYIVSGVNNTNDCGMAFITKDGDSFFLAVVNASGSCRVFDVEGNDVTESANAALIDEVKAAAASLKVPNESHIVKKFTAMLGDGASELAEIPAEGVFSSVVKAYSSQLDGKTLYCFAALPFGYGNMSMNLYFILDETGAIYAMSADSFILEADYFSSYELNEASYKEGFAGLTGETYSDDVALISGATISTDAVKTAAKDCFKAFDILVNGGENNA